MGSPLGGSQGVTSALVGWAGFWGPLTSVAGGTGGALAQRWSLPWHRGGRDAPIPALRVFPELWDGGTWLCLGWDNLWDIFSAARWGFAAFQLRAGPGRRDNIGMSLEKGGNPGGNAKPRSQNNVLGPAKAGPRSFGVGGEAGGEPKRLFQGR